MPHAIIAGIQKLQHSLEKTYDDERQDEEYKVAPSAALKAACAVVAVMEDDGAFNAGYGSMPNEEGNIEMDAAVMDGRDRSYGSVAVLGYFFVL